MNETYTFTLPHTVLYSEIDAKGLFSLPSFFSLFQEGAMLQAEELGFGETYCERENRMWVVSRLLLEIDSFPAHRDQIELSTWPKPPQGPFANRDFIIRAADGSIKAKATSAWLLLDLDTLRPVRPQALFKEYPLAELGEALPGTAPKISEKSEQCHQELSVTARYSDLDQNDHVNNTRYVRWFLDCYKPDEIHPEGKLRFSINYLSSAAFGDRLSLCRFDTDRHSTVRGFLENGSESFAAQIWLHEAEQ